MGIDRFYLRTMYGMRMYDVQSLYRLKNGLACLVVFRKRSSLGQYGIDDAIKLHMYRHGLSTYVKSTYVENCSRNNLCRNNLCRNDLCSNDVLGTTFFGTKWP
jgi:hypothetical protein